MEPWEIELENEVNNKPQIIVVKQKQSNHAFLYFVITMLILILCGTFAYKKVQKVRFWVQDHFKIENIKEITEQKDLSIIDRIKKIEEELKKNSQRIVMLGISQNENFSILSNENPKNNFIILNHDWTLNRKPEHLQIEDEDQKFIDNNIKQSHK